LVFAKPLDQPSERLPKFQLIVDEFNLFGLFEDEARYACQRPQFNRHQAGRSFHQLHQPPHRAVRVTRVLITYDPATAALMTSDASSRLLSAFHTGDT
jgi:hypothetical protein